MKAAYPLLIGIGLTASALAQDPADPKVETGVSEPVRKAIEEFNRRKNEAGTKANEVVVVLDPPAPPAEPPVEPPAAPDAEEEVIPTAEAVPEQDEPEEAGEETPPVLVTGKPPEGTEGEKEDLPAEPVAETEAETLEPEASTEPVSDTPAEPALEVRVESIRKGTGTIDPSQVKLKASFPPKPLSSAPEGWALQRSEQAPVFQKDVELQPGTTISLSIRPHVLAPDDDGLNTFSVGEPGFEAVRGYVQENTVSAILGTSVAQLDRDSLQLGNAISELHRLLASLPKPEGPEQPEKP